MGKFLRAFRSKNPALEPKLSTNASKVRVLQEQTTNCTETRGCSLEKFGKAERHANGGFQADTLQNESLSLSERSSPHCDRSWLLMAWSFLESSQQRDEHGATSCIPSRCKSMLSRFVVPVCIASLHPLCWPGCPDVSVASANKPTREQWNSQYHHCPMASRFESSDLASQPQEGPTKLWHANTVSYCCSISLYLEIAQVRCVVEVWLHTSCSSAKVAHSWVSEPRTGVRVDANLRKTSQNNGSLCLIKEQWRWSKAKRSVKPHRPSGKPTSIQTDFHVAMRTCAGKCTFDNIQVWCELWMRKCSWCRQFIGASPNLPAEGPPRPYLAPAVKSQARRDGAEESVLQTPVTCVWSTKWGVGKSCRKHSSLMLRQASPRRTQRTPVGDCRHHGRGRPFAWSNWWLMTTCIQNWPSRCSTQPATQHPHIRHSVKITYNAWLQTLQGGEPGWRRKRAWELGRKAHAKTARAQHCVTHNKALSDRAVCVQDTPHMKTPASLKSRQTGNCCNSVVGSFEVDFKLTTTCGCEHPEPQSGSLITLIMWVCSPFPERKNAVSHSRKTWSINPQKATGKVACTARRKLWVWMTLTSCHARPCHTIPRHAASCLPTHPPGPPARLKPNERQPDRETTMRRVWVANCSDALHHTHSRTIIITQQRKTPSCAASVKAGTRSCHRKNKTSRTTNENEWKT